MVNRRQLLKISALGTASFAAPLAYSASNITMAYNTGNAIGSTSPKDLSDNARNLDYLVNGEDLFHPDRKGVPRKSWRGMESEHNADQIRRESEFDADQTRRDSEFDADQARRESEFDVVQSERHTEFDNDQNNREVQFNNFMGVSGFEPPITYAAGIILDRTTKTVSYLGNEYRAKGSFIPLTTSNWAADEPKLKMIGDDSLRQELAAPTGADKSGFQSSSAPGVVRTAKDKLNETFSALDAGLPAGSSDTLRTAMANASYLQPMLYGSYRRINGVLSTDSVSDEANFAGQALGADATTGWVKHHYTDGTMMQMDNVGNGTALVLKNAHNPTRRSDKPSNYVGGGTFISLNEHDYAAGYSKGLFYISKAAEFVWTGVKSTVSFLQNKAEDALFAFQIRTTYAHIYLWRVLNAGVQVFSIENDVTNTRAVLRAGSGQTSGMLLTTDAGRLRLDCAGSYIEAVKPIRAPTGNLILNTVEVNKAVEVQVPFKPRGYSTAADLPSAASFVGCLALCGGVLVYSNGGVWKYVRDDAAVV
ncbi:hypothetical protein [Pseudomonas sp. GV085]|uniref:hypothetical protein n=1 Tax=Pseudomonas sp. GV085 TaxID=2135756 RepID=UPI000D3D5E3A|nr:hypothetical protein [Pseudomonas sp. GV085]PTR21160.1 hypothetical protein C8K63_115128 [Pseudomonas sp. GV085]